MAQRREIPEEQKQREGVWLSNLLVRHRIKQKDLARDMEIENPANISHWCTGRSPIPDLDLLWLAHHFKEDAFAIRPSLAEYANYFGSDKLLAGLSDEGRTRVIDYADMIRKVEFAAPTAKVYRKELTNPLPAPSIGKQVKFRSNK